MERFLEQQPAVYAAFLSTEGRKSEKYIPLYLSVQDKHVMGTEESLDDTETVKDIKAAIADNLGKRYANEREPPFMAPALDTWVMGSALSPVRDQ